MADTITLDQLHDEFSPSFLPYIPTLRQKRRANAFLKGSYTGSIRLSRQPNELIIQISAKVYRSQKKTEDPHSVNMDVDDKRIVDAHCSCKAGISGKCAHTLTVILQLEQWKIAGYRDIPAEPSCTSLPQTWDRPRGTKIQPEPVSQIIIANPGNSNRKRKPVMPEFQDNRKVTLTDEDIAHMKSLVSSPISYLVHKSDIGIQTPTGPQPLGSPLSYHIPLMSPVDIVPRGNTGDCGDLNFPKTVNWTPNLDDINKQKTDWDHLSVTLKESKAIEKATRRQAQSASWFEHRENRITASTFGSVMSRKKDFNDTFIKNTFAKTKFTSAPTSYGKANETIAKQMNVKKNGQHVHDIGLVINPLFPFLGASPDAIVCDNGSTGLVEIKCPYSVKDMTIEMACKERADFFLKEKNGQFVLSKSHSHWYQVQGQLLVTGASFCDFVTYTRHSLNIERIYPHVQTIESLLHKLSQLYVNHFKPYFAKKV